MIYDIKDERGRLLGSVEASSATEAKLVDQGAQHGLKITKVVHTVLDSMGRVVGKPRRGL